MPRASRLITGKFVVYRNDGTDAGADPDEVPVVGLVVYMTPAMERVKETMVPQTGFLETYWGTTGTDGVLKDSSGNTGIRVPVSVPENFTYKVVIVPPDGSNQAPFEFNWIIPSGTSALDITTAIPVPGNVGEDVILWRAAVEQTAANVAESEAIVATSVDNARLSGDNLELIRRDGTIIDVGDVRGPGGQDAYEIALTNGFVGSREEWLMSLNGQDGSNVVPTDTAIRDNLFASGSEWNMQQLRGLR